MAQLAAGGGGAAEDIVAVFGGAGVPLGPLADVAGVAGTGVPVTGVEAAGVVSTGGGVPVEPAVGGSGLLVAGTGG